MELVVSGAANRPLDEEKIGLYDSWQLITGGGYTGRLTPAPPSVSPFRGHIVCLSVGSPHCPVLSRLCITVLDGTSAFVETRHPYLFPARTFV